MRLKKGAPTAIDTTRMGAPFAAARTLEVSSSV